MLVGLAVALPAAGADDAGLELFHGPDETGSMVLKSLRMVLDGRELQIARPGDSERAVYSGPISSGVHRLQVEVLLEQGSSVFSYMEGYRIKMRTQLDLEVLPGEGVAIRSRVLPKGEITAPWAERNKLVLTLSAKGAGGEPIGVAAAAAPEAAPPPSAPAPVRQANEAAPASAAEAASSTPAPAPAPAAPKEEALAPPKALAATPEPARDPGATREPVPGRAASPARPPAFAEPAPQASPTEPPTRSTTVAAAPDPSPAAAAEPARRRVVSPAPQPVVAEPAPRASPAKPSARPAEVAAAPEPAATPAPAPEHPHRVASASTPAAPVPGPRRAASSAPPPEAIPGACELEPIRFEFDRAELTAEARGALDRFVACVAPTSLQIRVEGHADARGSDEYNRWLAWDRAAATSAYLRDHGLAHRRVTTRFAGKGHPLCAEETEDCFAQNRRVEVIAGP